jgi:uncharacterized protein (DUF1697 family)
VTRYVALLRGINVGGRNPVPMPALRALFEEEGFAEVATYIQSGNVLFSTAARGPALVRRIEAALTRAFGFPAVVVVRSREELARVVDEAPPGFGARPARRRYDALFLKEPLTAAAALAAAPVNPEVDEVRAGSGVLYYSRLVAKASRSRLSRITQLPIYRQMTIRNWNTTTALLRLMDGGASAPGVRRGGPPGARPVKVGGRGSRAAPAPRSAPGRPSGRRPRPGRRRR